MFGGGEAPSPLVVSEVQADGTAAERFEERAMAIRGGFRRFWQKNFWHGESPF
jgi:hypothetical protein